MNKGELINAIAEESGLNKADSKKALDAFISSVTKALKEGNKVALVGFGTSLYQKEQQELVSILLLKPRSEFQQKK